MRAGCGHASRTSAQGDSAAIAPMMLKSSSLGAAASAAAFLLSGGTMTPPGGTLGGGPTRWWPFFLGFTPSGDMARDAAESAAARGKAYCTGGQKVKRKNWTPGGSPHRSAALNCTFRVGLRAR